MAIHELQAAAAVGQMGLVQAYETAFKRFGLHTAQILLTHEDLSDRRRYLNARSTLLTLLRLGVIPVINENDTVTTDEIRLGDNDTLGALVTNLIEADVLILLTDQSGLYSTDPRSRSRRDDAAARACRRSRARSDCRRRRGTRPRRHADQGAGGETRGQKRGDDGDRQRSRGRRADPARRGRDARHRNRRRNDDPGGTQAMAGRPCAAGGPADARRRSGARACAGRQEPAGDRRHRLRRSIRARRAGRLLRRRGARAARAG